MKRWFWLAFIALGLAPAFAVSVGWQEIDLNGDGTLEHLAITQQADIGFNEQGQVVGWYPKRTRGQSLEGRYGRANNLVHSELPLPGTVAGFVPDQAEFSQEGDQLTARFNRGAESLTYLISANLFTVGIETNFSQPRDLTWSGIGGSERPVTKFLPVGGSEPFPAGRENAIYLAWQTRANTGSVFVLAPENPLAAELGYQAGGAVATIALPAGKQVLRVYGGPNELIRLYTEGFYSESYPGLFHPNFIGVIALGVVQLMELAYGWVGSWGLAILLITIVVRLLLWPLMQTQLRSMAELNRLRPEMEKIQKKFKDDRQKQAEATMALYKEHKVNPAAGCLPLLLQMPILYILWRAIAGYEFNQGFLWVPDLALPDPYYLLPVLYVGIVIVQTLISAQGNRQMIQQGLLMNLIFIFLILQFPAGVTLYWVFSMLLGVLQQWLINRSVAKAPAKAG